MHSGFWRRTMLISVLSITVVFCIFAAVFLLTNDQPAHAAAEGPTPLYVVREYRGFVAVFSQNNTVPDYVTDTPVQYLPLQDQSSLAEGISLYSETALDSLLEDYCS